MTTPPGWPQLREGLSWGAPVEVQPVVFRDAAASDGPFILNSWLKSYRSAPAVEHVPKGVYFEAQHARAVALLRRSVVLVACDTEAPDSVFGYAVYEPHAVHFVYVKSAFRRFGIAAELCRRAGLLHVPHTHDTKLGRHLARRLESPFNPYLVEPQ